MMGIPRKPAFFWVVVGLGLVLLAYYPFVVHVVLARSGSLRYRGWTAVQDGARGPVVRTVDEQGPAAGRLARRDRILAVSGDGRVFPELAGHFLDLRPGDAYALRVDRSGAEVEVPLLLGVRAQPWPIWLRLQFVVLSLGFYVAGLFIGLLRPAERTARFYVLASLMGAAYFLAIPLSFPNYLLGPLAAALVALLWTPTPLFAAVLYDGYHRFPPGVPPGRVWTALKPVFYAWGTVVFVWSAFDKALVLRGGKAVTSFASAHPSLWRAAGAVESTAVPLMACAALATLAVLARNYRVVSDPDQRRRIQWFVWGAGIGMLPSAAVLVYLTVATALGSPWALYRNLRWLASISNLAALAVPASFVYAVLKHDILDVRIALRRGVQYLLATGLLRLAVFGPLVVLAAGVLLNPNRTVGQILFGQPFSLALAVLGGLGLRYRQRLAAWLDRRFFREAYDSEQILLGLVDEVKKVDSLAEVARLVSGRVEAALHPEGVQLFWRDADRGFGLGHSSGTSTVAATVSEGSTLVRALEGSGEARELSAEEITEAGLVGAAGRPPCLAVPIGGGERRLGGFLLLGPKKSEEAYTREDRRLLGAIAAQIAIVHENAALKRRVSQDARTQQEVLAHLDASGVNLLKECPACGRCYDRAQEVCRADQSVLRLSLPIDRTVDGKYRLDRLLGRGGMGAVYEATDLRLGRRVAVKVMTGASFGNEDALRRFEREARASARLEHPNIITIFDYGHVGADGAYLVMERLTGTTLRAELQRNRGLDPDTSAQVFGEMLDGVAAAHRAGVIHRDLKPENVFLAADGKGGRIVKVLDFGLAKLTLGGGDEPSSLTAAGTVMGTLAYMSPEQLKGMKVDQRTDIFSIGVMVAEAAVGFNPFKADDTTQTVAAILAKPFRLEGGGPEVQALDAALQGCLAKDADSRFASVGEARAALVPALRACPRLRAGRGGPSGTEDSTRVR